MKERYYEKYIGKWVSITPLPGETVIGLMEDYNDSYAIINPVLETIYNKGYPETAIVEMEVPARVRIDDAVSIVPKTKKNLEEYCKFRNKERKKEMERQKNQEKENLEGSNHMSSQVPSNHKTK